VELTKRTVEATQQELAAIAKALDAHAPTSGSFAGNGSERIIRRGTSRRTLLLPALNALKDQMGWISQGAVEELSEQLLIPRADIYGVATFYALLPTTPQPDKAIHICTNMACRFMGAEELLEQTSANLESSEVAVHASPCLGQCELAPMAFVECAGSVAQRFCVPEANPARLEAAVEAPELAQKTPSEYNPASIPLAYSLGKPKLLQRILDSTPTTLDSYRASGGYHALELAIQRGPEWVLGELEKSQLRGRGGAAFPTAIKWRAVAQADQTERYVVANADESEPGTFKDRVLLENDPFALIEAMTIAGYVTGAQRGYIYVRSEYPAAMQILAQACLEASEAKLLGSDVAGADFSFILELRQGAGAYICGEETALFNSIEGYRGEPRSKPPFPTEVGLFGKPTLINNVETFANILPILTEGSEAFAQVGTEASKGTRLFCLSGACAKPGLYEVPLGTTLFELLQLAGAEAEPLVLLGGAAGAFVGPEQLAVPLSFEDTGAVNLTLGSGAVIVVPDSADIADLIANIVDFFVDESCGQCVPCRVGTVRQKESLERLRAVAENDNPAPRGNPAQSHERDILADLDAVMTDASICGLGQTAAAAVRSAIQLNLLKV